MSDFNIFFDLDDTLIYSKYGETESFDSMTMIFGETVSSIKRPIADELLSFARNIDPNTRMLTTATIKWAKHWNEEFNLGFSEEQIYSRADFTMEKPDGFYSDPVVWNEQTLGIENGCIIDNLPLEHITWNLPPQHKLKFVFGDIKPEKWIQIAEYSGPPDEGEEAELQRIKNEILKAKK